MLEFRCGDWRDVLGHVDHVDAVITDPAYGERTHKGHDSASEQVVSATGQTTRQSLGYSFFTPENVREFVGHWSPRCDGWMAVFSCSDLAHVWRDEMDAAGRQTFAPLWIRSFTPRLLGDGPSSVGVYLNIARPRSRKAMQWATLPAEYKHHKEPKMRIGGKSRQLMRAIVGDYADPGAIVCDPFAGYGTTLLAARDYGCSGIGAEVDPAAFCEAQKRISKPWQVQRHPRTTRHQQKPQQAKLFDVGGEVAG